MQILKGIIKKDQSETMKNKLLRITYLQILNKNKRTVCFENTVQKFLMFKEYLKHYCLQFSYNLLISNFTVPEAKCTVQYNQDKEFQSIHTENWPSVVSALKRKKKGFSNLLLWISLFSPPAIL